MGRPIKLSDAGRTKKRVDEYFDRCDKEKQVYTIYGLCNELNITLDTFNNILNGKKAGYTNELVDVIKKAKARVAALHEQRLCGANCTGSIFWLKSQTGWQDTQKIETNVSGGIDVNIKIVD